MAEIIESSPATRRNTAAVIRDGTHHIFVASDLTGDNYGIIQITAGDELFNGRQSIVTVDEEFVRAAENTPLAATVVWDNTQINLYYLVRSTGGTFLREICQKDDGPWIEGSLSGFLLREGVFPAPDATVTVWNDNENINVYFKSTDDAHNEITFAKYFAADSQWNVKKITY